MYNRDDAEDINQPLTSTYTDLIYGRKIATSHSDHQFNMISTTKTLTKRAKYQFCTCVLNTSTKQWQQDYLLHLREEDIVQTRPPDAAPVKEGDIVIIKEDSTVRALWKLARFVEILEGRWID